MTNKILRIGLVGCGQIADAHLQQIRRVSNAETVAVCDIEPLLARQAAERFGVPMRFSNLNAMLHEGKLDLVFHCLLAQRPSCRTINGLVSDVFEVILELFDFFTQRNVTLPFLNVKVFIVF